jgi:hypothetical protein
LEASIAAVKERPGSLLAQSNIPHALLLLGEYDAAWAKYREHSGKLTFSCGTCHDTWEDTILRDLIAMHRAGIRSPMMAELLQYLLAEENVADGDQRDN